MKVYGTVAERLKIYEDTHGLVTQGLDHICCIISTIVRPMIDWKDVPKVFPEFSKHFIYKFDYNKGILTYHKLLNSHKDITQKWRLKVLDDCIKQCKQKIKDDSN